MAPKTPHRSGRPGKAVPLLDHPRALGYDPPPVPMVSPAVSALALVSALLSAAGTVLISRGLRRYGPYTGFWINLAVGTACVWIAVVFTGGVGRPSPAGIAYFAL